MSLTAGQRGIKRQRRQASELEQERELRRCAERGDLDRVRELVEIHRVNVNCADGRGRTPLILTAIYNNNGQVARLLLENNANVAAHVNSDDGWTALTFAVFHDKVAVAELLLEYGANANKHFRLAVRTCSPLGWAMFKGNVDMVALLLRSRANTEEVLYLGKTYSASYLACSMSNNVEIVRLLLDHDDDVDVNIFAPRDDNNEPALSYLCQACRRNNLEMAELLLQRGARVIFDGGVYPDVPCPLRHAVENGSLKIVRFLLNNSRFSETANENARLQLERIDNHPLSPALEAAILWNHVEEAQLLVDRGANVNDRPFLWPCAKFGWRLEVVRLLLRAGANVNLAHEESDGESPLWAAAEKGHVIVVQEFLKARRADVRICNNGGETPLGVAYRQGYTDIVYLLLRTSPHVWSKLAEIW